ncbi:ketosamine-3-kinase-like [Oppia nitens]|uniref:ketosamine-3-kinase-like n=1 Tax=Oppia nitens TaxID=1686743 RepID=UPI0023DC263C|nr:ketosamine-3-kinase-like [Oppia nitens]
MEINDEIKDKLETKIWKKVGTDRSGCISTGEIYETDNGLVFVKKSTSEDGFMMFSGEFESLKTIDDTHTIRVPKPLHVVPEIRGSGGAIVMEYLNILSLRQQSGRLGELLAQMHLFNTLLGNKIKKNESWIGKNKDLDYISQFGFHVTTYCGSIAQNNDWEEDWIQFYARNKLKQQIDLIEKNEGNRELIELWSILQMKIDKFFTDLKDKSIIPALLHGDLWSGNAAQTVEEPVVFDASSFYGHSEFDLSIGHMFGGFNRNFYECYFNKIPKSSGFDKRDNLYQLFHYLNHWNHFGGQYKQQSLSLMRRCVESLNK